MEYGLFLLFAGLIIPVLLGSAMRIHSLGVLLAILVLQGLKIADTLFTTHVQRFLSSFYAFMSDSEQTRFLAYISGRLFIVLISLLPFAMVAGVIFWLAFTKLDEEQVQKLKRWTKMDRKAQHITGAISMGMVAYIIYFWGSRSLIGFNLLCALLFGIMLFPEVRNALGRPPLVEKDLREADHLLQESIKHRKRHEWQQEQLLEMETQTAESYDDPADSTYFDDEEEVST